MGKKREMGRALPTALAVTAALGLAACGRAPLDPDDAPRAVVDRFSDEAATMMVRSANPALPAAGEPIDFDQAPFVTRGLGPRGERVRYYNFDAMPVTPAPIYQLVFEGSGEPVPGQLPILTRLPGDEGYNDFVRVNRVEVPQGYRENTLVSLDELLEAAHPIIETDRVLNRPVVPEGSTASLRTGGEVARSELAWHEGEVVTLLHFDESEIVLDTNGALPEAPIYVAFDVNPGEPGGGPESGPMTEPGTDQTHNVVEGIPGDASYSPLWRVYIYDNADFDTVTDLDAIFGTTLLACGVAKVNCPIVAVE